MRLITLAGGTAILPLRTSECVIGVPPTTAQRYRIRPLPNVTYGRSFLRFCKRARFVSFNAAVASVCSIGQPFLVEKEENNLDEWTRVSHYKNLAARTHRAPIDSGGQGSGAC